MGAKPNRLARIPEGRNRHRYAVRDLSGPPGGRLVLGADLRLTMDREFWLLLAGAGIAMVSSGGATLLQHYLALRADRIKRERDATERQRTVLREDMMRLTDPTQQLQIAALSDEHLEKLARLAVKNIRKTAATTGTPADEEQD